MTSTRSSSDALTTCQPFFYSIENCFDQIEPSRSAMEHSGVRFRNYIPLRSVADLNDIDDHAQAHVCCFCLQVEELALQNLLRQQNQDENGGRSSYTAIKVCL